MHQLMISWYITSNTEISFQLENKWKDCIIAKNIWKLTQYFILNTNMNNSNIHFDTDQLLFRDLLQNIFRFGETQSLTLFDNGYDTIKTLIHW